MKYFTLPQAILISVTGPQAERYLQIRLTNDIKKLSPQRAVLAAALTPQGRTEGLFTVLGSGPAAFLLFTDGGDSNAVIEGLKRFIVTERMEVNDVSRHFILLHLVPSREKEDMGALLPPPPVHAIEFSRVSAGAIQFIARRRTEDWGWDVIVPNEQKAAFFDRLREKKAVEISPQVQELLRLRAGVPRFPTEINAEHILTDAGLAEAISYTKGCYTGQEVIAKIDALGKSPRTLIRMTVAGTGPISHGAELTIASEKRPIGEVLSSAVDEENMITWIFASVRSSVDLTTAKIYVNEREATVLASAAAPGRKE